MLQSIPWLTDSAWFVWPFCSTSTCYRSDQIFKSSAILEFRTCKQSRVLSGWQLFSNYFVNNPAKLRSIRNRLRGPPTVQTHNKISKPGQKVLQASVGQPRVVGLKGKDRPHSHPGNSLVFQGLGRIWVGNPGCISCAESWPRVPPQIGLNRTLSALWSETSLGGSCNRTYKR